MSRRHFLKTSLAVVPAAAAMPVVFRNAVASAFADGQPHPGRTLVIVQMAGGNDGLNTVVPATDGRYYDLREGLAIPDGDAIQLDPERGLHPSLLALKTLWDEGRLAIVEGVGYEDPSLSHFQAMDTWQTADPSGRALEGWLGRYLNGVRGSKEATFPGLAVGRTLPPELFTSRVPVPIVERVEEYRVMDDPRHPLWATARTKALTSLYNSAPDASPWGAVLDNTWEAAQRSSQAIAGAHDVYIPAVEYPDSRLAQSLRLVAEAIAGDLGVMVAHVRIGGFDTHATQVNEHAALLKTTAEAILSFYQDLQAHDRDRNVLLMTWSEFGRRVKANASGGTDHGTAGPMFVVGTPVKGGLFGERPSLNDLNRDNLKFTTDFRSVYASVLDGWLGAPSELVLGARFETLPLLVA